MTAVNCLRTMGATRVPRSSIDLNIFSCGNAETPIWKVIRARPPITSFTYRILYANGFGIADEQRTCPSPKLDRRNRVDFSISYREQSTDMPEFLLRLVRLVWLFARGQQAFVLEHRAPPTMGSLQTSSQVSTLKSLRPSVLDRACKVLEELATSTTTGLINPD